MTEKSNGNLRDVIQISSEYNMIEVMWYYGEVTTCQIPQVYTTYSLGTKELQSCDDKIVSSLRIVVMVIHWHSIQSCSDGSLINAALTTIAIDLYAGSFQDI